MYPNTNMYDAWKAYLSCQTRSYEKAGHENNKRFPQPFVTLSLQTGAGGLSIGETLVEFLREHDKYAVCPWTFFDHNLISAVLQEHHLPPEFAKFLPEAKISETQDMVEELFGLHPSAWALVQKTSQTILHLAQMGNVVLSGRGANIITKKFLSTGVHVRIVESLRKRVQNVQAYHQLTQNEAVTFIRKEDEGKRQYLSQNFGKNIDDPLLYHFVINTDFMTYEETIRLIANEVVKIHRQIEEQTDIYSSGCQ